MSFYTIKKQRLKDVNKCELCGSTLGLELHHIIPKVYGGEDTEDNLILICRGCHSKLTPKSTLTKKGMQYSKSFILSPIYLATLLTCEEWDCFDSRSIWDALKYVCLNFDNLESVKNYNETKLIELKIDEIHIEEITND